LMRFQQFSVTALLAMSWALAACGSSDDAAPAASGDEILTKLLDANLVEETSGLVAIQTFRDESPDSEKRVLDNMEVTRSYLQDRVDAFNAQQASLRLEPFEWKKTIDGVDRWVFGYRLGNGEHKIAIYTHLDTVPPGSDAWKPFEPRVETRAYRGGEQPFLVGRGSSDDKGPAVVALNAMRAAGQEFDRTGALSGLTLELAFDTAEETDEHMPFYVQDTGSPALGIVFDAMWTVRAEKGIERPVFRVARTPVDTATMQLVSIDTPPGPANQIADSATARISGGPATALDQLAGSLESAYASYGFDDPNYRRAPLQLTRDGDAIVLTTTVLGAQHGSVPYQNRETGANPLVSLANFLAHLVEDGTLPENDIGRMCRFMSWGWGTKVFGENQPDLLQRSDEVFTEGNGTTYALTRFNTTDQEVTLSLDVRYAIGHHSQPWDGKTQGLLPGKSTFQTTLETLMARFDTAQPGLPVTFTTSNAFAPDIRDPQGPELSAIASAYEKVMGTPTPMLAIGGGTDAKGHPALVGAGALFSDDLGPPINYHGLDEGAPLDDLRTSGRILYRLVAADAKR
jgi:succinyl-diaminopimelate desuccinylase